MGWVVHLLQLLAHRVVCGRPDDRNLCALDVLQLLAHRYGHLGNIQREASHAARQRPARMLLLANDLPLLGRASPSANSWIKELQGLAKERNHKLFAGAKYRDRKT